MCTSIKQKFTKTINVFVSKQKFSFSVKVNFCILAHCKCMQRGRDKLTSMILNDVCACMCMCVCVCTRVCMRACVCTRAHVCVYGDVSEIALNLYLNIIPCSVN